jgi:N-acetylglucosaminyldiphosphoundecaprenol N-acetyl-beta-D-mannosaminyltransferase
LPRLATEIPDRQTGTNPPDDLMREVYCVLGMPVDSIEMESCVSRIEAAAAHRLPFLVSTANLNFLVNVQTDAVFRASLIQSDLCTADGAPIIFIARLLGIPIKNRVAGSDLFEVLKAKPRIGQPLKIYFFGGAEGAASTASRRLSAGAAGICCVGAMYPGFGSVEELSQDDIIDAINSSRADFLVASLGAKKGQAWLLRNHHRLQIPIRAHLGAVINFQAGTVKRSPKIMRKLGLEWLWRIKEEPHLWRRYSYDGYALLRLLVMRILPLAVGAYWASVKSKPTEDDLIIGQTFGDDTVTVSLAGPAIARHIEKIICAFKAAIDTNKNVLIDLANTRVVDARFLGLMLMLEKKLKARGAAPNLTGLSPGLKKIFRLNGLDALLRSSARVDGAPSFGGSNERTEHQSQNGSPAKRVRDDLEAATLPDEQPFQ